MKITSKGQVTIPEALRQEYGMLPNTDVSFERKKHGLFLKKGKPAKSGKSRGEMMVDRLRGAGNGKWTTDQIMKLMRG